MSMQRFRQMLPGVLPKSTPHFGLHHVRHYAIQSRLDLLNSIYRQPFAKLKKGSPEYLALARSGRVWENFFQPGNLEPYLQAQSDLKQTLSSIDELKEFYREKDEAKKTILRALVSEYAHQSTSLEQNPLRVGESLVIFDELEKQLFSGISLDVITTSELSKLAFPTPGQLLPDKDANQVTELRNHLIVSRHITEAALSNPSTAGMSVTDIKQLSGMMLRGTDAEALYALSWGKRTQMGEYRAAPITVKSNPMRVFPYPQEVSAYGNGRLGRVLMADYLIRQGYLPLVFVTLAREDYLEMISDAQEGKPGALCATVAQTQHEMLWEITMRE
ncbi:hypothetical protein LOCC1_G007715 [Lachnellula occidentalis]|uniref:Uncharacterized protein n=1 Tax=Lachnellula occidentalis TaxID=215460 RepID=A0A8H8U772_9HELO|nr:hypothetical protein LOCC1_G007715 [Lachnellula occidentalis]